MENVREAWPTNIEWPVNCHWALIDYMYMRDVFGYLLVDEPFYFANDELYEWPKKYELQTKESPDENYTWFDVWPANDDLQLLMSKRVLSEFFR
jgi:hypothetical protein